MTNLILWCLSLLLGIVITVILTEPIHYRLIKILGGITPRKKRGVKGLWKATYSFERDGITESETNLLELRQVGDYVIGKNLTGNDWYKIEGKINSQTYLTGVWECTSEDSIYNGAFQFIISPSGDSMEGKWVGFSRRQCIYHGIWVWERLSRKIDAESKAKLIEEFSQQSKQLNP